MKEISIQRRRGTCCRRYARIVRISILLLQLLCLPQCDVILATASTGGGEAVVEPASSDALSEHHNLRVAHSSPMGYLASLADAFSALLGNWFRYTDPVAKHGELSEDASSDTKIIHFHSDVIEEKAQDWADTTELDRDRRLAKRSARGSRTIEMKWYVDWINAQCVQSCDPRTTTNPNCAGLAMRENFLFDSAKRCCKTMIPWKSYDLCTRVGSPDGTLNQVYEDLNKPVNNWGNVMVDPPVNNVKPPITNSRPLSTAQTFSQGKPPKSEPVPKDQVPAKQQIVPKSSCWRSGMTCASEAEKFACCGICSNGVCI